MRTNISSVQAYLECPRLWYYKYVLKRGIESDSEALRLGTIWHQICADERDIELSDPEWMHAALTEFDLWKLEHPEVKFLGVEVEMEAELGGHTLIGRLDSLIEWNGKLWHGQHKSTAATTNIPIFSKLISRSFHEHGYRKMVEDKYHKPYGGTILFIAKKLSDKAISEGKSPFMVEFLPITPGSALLDDLATFIGLMESSAHCASQWQELGWLPPQNPDACGGRFKNHLCEYIDVCEGKMKIEEMGEVNPLKGYKIL